MSARAAKTSPMIKADAPLAVVTRLLEDYAARGVFRGFSAGEVREGQATFRILWHRNCVFELLFDLDRQELRCPQVLANVPADSAMYRELKEFIKSRHADELPEHRRIDRRQAQVQ